MSLSKQSSLANRFFSSLGINHVSLYRESQWSNCPFSSENCCLDGIHPSTSHVEFGEPDGDAGSDGDFSVTATGTAPLRLPVAEAGAPISGLTLASLHDAAHDERG